MALCFSGLFRTSGETVKGLLPEPKKPKDDSTQRVSMSGASEGLIHPRVGSDSLPSTICEVTDMKIKGHVLSKFLPSTRSTLRSISEDTLGPNSITQENHDCSGTSDLSIFMILVANQRKPGKGKYSPLYLARQQSYRDQFLSARYSSG